MRRWWCCGKSLQPEGPGATRVQVVQPGCVVSGVRLVVCGQYHLPIQIGSTGMAVRCLFNNTRRAASHHWRLVGANRQTTQRLCATQQLISRSTNVWPSITSHFTYHDGNTS